MKTIPYLMLLVMLVNLTSCKGQSDTKVMNEKNAVALSDEEWKAKLSPEEYRVLREKGTERAYIGEYDQFWEPGIYTCKGCSVELFESTTKFDAGCGWPSFYESIDKSKIKEEKDYAFGMVRIEVMCANCGGHLGHVFDDGPKPTGLRYCINSVSLGFKKKE
jgi:peptide-methionine (R)-S-oxide reductase